MILYIMRIFQQQEDITIIDIDAPRKSNHRDQYIVPPTQSALDMSSTSESDIDRNIIETTGGHKRT